jgi:hypothetical protein
MVLGMTRRSGSPKQRVALAVVANLATHPLVWFVFPELGISYRQWLVLAEVWAVAIEAIAYATQLRSLGARRAVLVSLAANAASVAVGLALRSAGADV